LSWEIRPTTDLAEFKAAVGSIGHYFGGWPADDEAAERFARNLPFERLHAAFDDGRIVGGAGAFPFQLSVPGGDVACAGVTVVGVLPTHRRRGILSAMMRAQLEDVRDRGEPIAALWASEEPIYRRYGYGMASLAGEMTLPRGYSGLRAEPDPSATARLVSLEDAAGLVPGVYERVRGQVPGMPSRSETWWETRNLADPPERREGGGQKNVLVVELEGEPVGYALYRVHSRFEAGAAAGHVAVIEAMAEGATATRELWRVLLSLDWTASFEAGLLPVDHPLLHQLLYPRRMRFRVGDGLWVRLVDVGAALAARAYGDGDTVVFEIEDALLPANAGRWRLSDGRAERTDDAADLVCDVGELGAAYLGGFSFGELVRAGTVREAREGAARRADALFLSGHPKPWCPEIF
jgi:predicted acetyltransferase